MAFFDKKQEVIDIKLTQFGKNLLARGFFKPVYYRFFDDGILYNSECAGFSEEQNSAEERILQAQRPKTQHLTLSVEEVFDINENLINSGEVKTFMQISRRQDTLVLDKILKYPLESSEINSNEAPRLHLALHGPKINTALSTEVVATKGTDLNIPQLNITSSYTLVKDTKQQVQPDRIPQTLIDAENYIDLSQSKISFLDKSEIRVKKEDLIIDLQELGVDLGLDNFEIEVFEVIDLKGGEKQNIKIESEEELKKLFDIKTDAMVSEIESMSHDGRKSPRGRKQ